MKNILLALFVFAFCDISFCQLNNTDKITEVYGQEWLDRMQTEAPDLLILIDKYVQHGFMVKNVSEGKYSEFVPLEFIQLSSKEGGEVTVEEFLIDFASTDFNPLKYQFFPGKDFQVYKLKDVNKIIYILPQESILLK